MSFPQYNRGFPFVQWTVFQNNYSGCLAGRHKTWEEELGDWKTAATLRVHTHSKYVGQPVFLTANADRRAVSFTLAE